MTKNTLTDAAVNVVGLLTPFLSEDRQRIIHAAWTLLGEETDGAIKKGPLSKNNGEDETDPENAALPVKAKAWIKQNGLTAEELNQAFHIAEGSADVIGEVPGKNDKERTLNAYVLTGIARLLATGVATFDDKAARAQCKTSGCYNNANHAVYLKDMGNGITGTKDKGWTLTMPGLRRGADLVKAISGRS